MITKPIELRHDGKVWHLAYGRYRGHFPACACDRPLCTCKRRLARNRRSNSHEFTHCHAGHAEHMAVLFRRIVRGLKR